MKKLVLSILLAIKYINFVIDSLSDINYKQINNLFTLTQIKSILSLSEDKSNIVYIAIILAK